MATAPTIAVTDDGLASSAIAEATRSYVHGPFRCHFRNSEDLYERINMDFMAFSLVWKQLLSQNSSQQRSFSQESSISMVQDPQSMNVVELEPWTPIEKYPNRPIRKTVCCSSYSNLGCLVININKHMLVPKCLHWLF
ncbi:hypothetical protein DPMN_022184 [Dreissena polymorpha]|uniref:Uncharacterized protein n=1 Tax=Dreissena polymorpha TaxID=45954 RepID=A0A9D4SBJ4_DREPO|nr:hypothetical protein DPMN_022184 [Dreissena polymorpha]